MLAPLIPQGAHLQKPAQQFPKCRSLCICKIIIIIIIYRFLERHILKALWRFTNLKINKKLQKTIKSLSKKKGLKAPFECV